jgi:uncharacterized integral membrane protein
VRFLRWIFTIAAGLAVIVFAVANRTPARVSFDPLPFSFDTPIYTVAFAALILGFVAGAAVAWVNGRKWRRLARKRKRRTENLEREIARLRGPVPEDGARANRLPKAGEPG